MNVESKRGADPTLFGMDAEDFNKLTDINKLRKCWTYSTSKLSLNYQPLYVLTYCNSCCGPNVE